MYLFIILLGLVLGSFATAMIYRIPRGLPWRGLRRAQDGVPASRSVCPQCKTVLEARDLIPVISWLALRGKCRNCGAPIGAVYPLTELGVVLACVGIYAAGGGWSLNAAFMIAAVPFLAALLIIDCQRLLLPNELVVILGCLGLGRLAEETFYARSIGVYDLVFEYLAAGFLYGVLAWGLGLAMTKLLKRDALGFGDVKFFAVAGLWLGILNLGWFCVLSGVFGVILGIGWKIWKKNEIFPFGPALIVSFYLLLIFTPHS